MTDEEIDAQFSVFAVMLAVPFLNGDHGEIPLDGRSDIQGTLWRYGYIPAQQLLLENGATPEQVERGYLYTVSRAKDGSLGRPKYRHFGPRLAPAMLASIARGDGLRATARLLGLDPKTLMREAAMAGVEVPWATKPSGVIPAAKAMPVPVAHKLRRTRPARARRNWFAIDVRLARSARESVGVILAQSPPLRVTFAEIERRISRRDWIVKRRAKLPQTDAAISAVAEGVAEFRWRRLENCVAAAVATGDLRPCEVLRAAGLPTTWLPAVRDAIACVQRRGRAVA